MEEREPFSHVIQELNKRFGANLTERDKLSIGNLEDELANEPPLQASVRANTLENARLTFDNMVRDHFQELVETNFELYKRVVDDEAFR